MLDLAVSVLWLSRSTYLPGCTVEDHDHPFYHCLYVMNGSAAVNIGDETHTMQENELYLFLRSMRHGFTVDAAKGMKTVEVKFTASESLAVLLERLKSPVRTSDITIRHTAENLISEGTAKGAYYTDIIHLKLLEILLYSLRMNTGEQSSQPRSAQAVSHGILMEIPCPDQSGLPEALSYMRENLSRQLPLETLARVSGMGKSHFIRQFRSTYGMTPLQYLTALRMDRAKELMRYSDQNITQIANSTGFEDVHYFSRLFKKREHISPIEYVKKVRGSLYIFLNDEQL